MLRYSRRRSWAIVWARLVLLSLLSMFSPSSFSATNAALSIQEIARHQLRLDDARARQSAVGSALSCLAFRDAKLVARRDASQIQLGDMRQREQVLRADVARGRAARDGHLKVLEHEARNLDRLRSELRELQEKRAGQDQELRECKARSWLPDFMCDFAKSIAHLTGLFEDVDERIRTAERNVQRAGDGVNHSQAQIDQVQNLLDKAVAEAVALDSEIRRTESEIGATQAELSVLRDQAHAHQLLLDEFADALAQAALIDTDDGRMRTQRQLSAAAQRFDAGASRLAAAVNNASRTLPAESAVCIRR